MMVRLFALGLALFAAPASATDPACTLTSNLSMHYCPSGSTDWYTSYTDWMTQLDSLAKTAPSSFTVLGAGGLLTTYGVRASTAVFSVSVDTYAVIASTGIKIGGTGGVTAAFFKGTISGADLVAGSVDTTRIGSGAIDTSKHGLGSVTTSVIADASVTAVKMVNSGVHTGDSTSTFPAITISAGAINTGKLASGAVDTSKILGAAVTSIGLAPGAADTTKLGSGSVDTAKILFAAVGTLQLQALSVDTSKLASGSVDTSKHGLGSVTATVIADGAVNTAKLGSGAVDTSKILSNVVDTSKLNAAGVTDGFAIKALTGAAVWGATTGGHTLSTSTFASDGTITTAGGAFPAKSTAAFDGAYFKLYNTANDATGITLSTGSGAAQWTSWTPVWTGFTASPTCAALYQQIGAKVVIVVPDGCSGTSNATGMTMTLPVAALVAKDMVVAADDLDNGTRSGQGSCLVRTAVNSTTLTIFKDWSGNNWTNANSKACQSFIYTYQANTNVGGILSSTSAIAGVTDGTNANAGYVGELISGTLGVNQIPGASATYVAIATITLTAGDWDVTATAEMDTGGTSAISQTLAAISTSDSTADTLTANNFFIVASAPAVNSGIASPLGPRRVSITSSTTYYLVGRLIYTVLGGAVWAASDSIIRARRVR